MNAELVLFNKHINMASRGRRRLLVLLVYGTYALLMACAWPIDRWAATGTFLFLASFPVNRFLFGGYYPGGLVRPFHPNSSYLHGTERDPQWLALVLRMAPNPSKYKDEADEREQLGLDNGHFIAYRWLAFVIFLLMFLIDIKRVGPIFGDYPKIPLDLLYGTSLIGCFLAITLPQAIILWTEPDMVDAQS
jgi:hypothetical protein